MIWPSLSERSCREWFWKVIHGKNSCCVFDGFSLVSFIMSCSNRKNWDWVPHSRKIAISTTSDTTKLFSYPRPHIASPVKTYLATLKREIPLQPPYSPDIAHSVYHLFRPISEKHRMKIPKNRSVLPRGKRMLPQRWERRILEFYEKMFGISHEFIVIL